MSETNDLKVIDERTVLGKNFRIFGTFEEPLFLAKDVAEWIDYGKNSKGVYDVSAMLRTVDETEKIVITLPIMTTDSDPINNPTAIG